MPPARVAMVALLLATVLVAPVAGHQTVSADTDPHIDAVLPNPVAEDDAGEYVAVAVPAGNWTLSDGESTVRIERRTAGSVVVTNGRGELVDRPDGATVVADLSLANAGERLVLARDGTDGEVVDVVEYDDAPEGERWVTGDDPRWQPVGYEPRTPESLGAADATAFLLPDSPDRPVAPIRAADDRVLLAGYTFASERVTAALIAAHERGATVRVLLDGGPVGGITDRQAGLLDRLVDAGVEVRVVTGPRARFRYHHAKYAVADDRAVVLTENWKPSGTGGADSRGWGVVLRSQRAADALAALYRTDAGWRDAVSWREFRAGRTFTEADEEGGEGTYPSHHGTADVRVERATLLTAPGNAETAVVSVIDDADDRVDVLQPTVADGPLLAATRRAAERGVTVRLLVSNAWYVADENAALVERLNAWAERTGAPLEARVADPDGRFGKVHAKGVVADDTAVVGSLNWNPTSATENREVVVALHGEDVAAYYRSSFAADWRAGRGGVPGLGGASIPPVLGIVAVGAAAGVVLLLHRRIAFDAGGDDEGGPLG